MKNSTKFLRIIGNSMLLCFLWKETEKRSFYEVTFFKTSKCFVENDIFKTFCQTSFHLHAQNFYNILLISSQYTVYVYSAKYHFLNQQCWQLLDVKDIIIFHSHITSQLYHFQMPLKEDVSIFISGWVYFYRQKWGKKKIEIPQWPLE